MPCSLADVHIVLLRPRWAANLGSVARAMKNFGLQRLSLVDSRIGSWADAFKMAVGAHDVLDGAVRSVDLAQLLGDATWIAGTTNDPPPGTRVLTPREAAAEASRQAAPVFLFGGEIHGLEPKELLRCHVISRIPTAPSQSSLNLAQAVCVHAAELFGAFGEGAPGAPPSCSPPPPTPADTNLMQRLEASLTHLLATSAWADASRNKHAVAELMQPLYRAQLTEAEVRAWLVALNKAAQR